MADNKESELNKSLESAYDRWKENADKEWERLKLRDQQREAFRISQNLGGENFEGILETIQNDKDWAKILDQEALERSLKQVEQGAQVSGMRGSVGRLLGEGLKTGDAEVFRSMFEKTVGDDGKEVPGKFSERGFRDLTDNQRLRVLQMMRNDVQKDLGENTWRTGLLSGTVATQKQLAAASPLQRLGYLGKTIVDVTPGLNLFTEAGRDIVGSNLGYLTSTAKIQMATSSTLGKLGIGFGTAAAGLFTAYSAANSDNIAMEFLATTSASIGMQSGWRLGKATSSAMGATGHFGRVVLGGTGAIAGTVGGYGAFKLLEDLGSSQSVLVGLAKQLSSREIMYTTPPETKIHATMRQAALHKLSSSSLNNRGQLLGNEAAILRGMPLG